jgi:DNA polymerase III alpha subunit (gram-positive type)
MAGHGFYRCRDLCTSLFLKSTDEMLAEFAYSGRATLAHEVVVQAPQRVADTH